MLIGLFIVLSTWISIPISSINCRSLLTVYRSTYFETEFGVNECKYLRTLGVHTVASMTGAEYPRIEYT